MSGGISGAAARAQRHLRWQRERLARSARQLAVLDLRHDAARGLHLAGWQRSGSTWMARMMASSPATRMVYEPSNIRHGLFEGGAPHHQPLPLAGPDDDLGIEGQDIVDALEGRVSTTWTNPQRTDRLPRRRVVKDVRTVGCVPWIAGRLPDSPVVLLVRHPVAVAHSILELGWGAEPELTGPGSGAVDPELARAARRRGLLAEMELWAEHHAFALRHPAAERVHVVLYEELVEDTAAELDRMGSYLRRFPEHWADWRPDPARIAEPSKTSFRRAEGSAQGWIDSWSDSYDAEELSAAVDLLGRWGLDRLYGAGPLPLVSGAEVRSAVAG